MTYTSHEKKYRKSTTKNMKLDPSNRVIIGQYQINHSQVKSSRLFIHQNPRHFIHLFFSQDITTLYYWPSNNICPLWIPRVTTTKSGFMRWSNFSIPSIKTSKRTKKLYKNSKRPLIAFNCSKNTVTIMQLMRYSSSWQKKVILTSIKTFENSEGFNLTSNLS